MDAQTQKSRQLKLKRQLDKSLSRVHLSKRGKFTNIDKSSIKRTAVDTIQRFLKSEINMSGNKTYDWYFTKKENGNIEVGTPRRNDLGLNRYYVIDYREVPINTKYSFASTIGEERVKQYDITNKQISDIISGSKQLFKRLLEVTVSQKEDAKIYRAYDKVDEKMIFTVTLGFPIVVIAAVEALPFLIAEGELLASSGSYFKTALSGSTGLGLRLNPNAGTSLAHSFGDATAQYVGNGFDIRKVDPYKAVVSGIFKTNTSSIFLRSSVSSKSENDYLPELNSFSEMATEFSLGLMGNAVNKKIADFGLSGFDPNVGGFLEQSLKVGSNSTKTAINVEIKKEISKD